jgi:hypothetical protein
LRIEPRRAGDVDKVWADASLAQDLLRWRTTLGVENMCQDGWRWQQRNPAGYGVAVSEAGTRAGSAAEAVAGAVAGSVVQP